MLKTLTLQTPVPTGFFPMKPVFNVEVGRYNQAISDETSLLMNCVEDANAFHWSHVETKNGVQIHRAQFIEQCGTREGSVCVLFRGTMFAPGKISEVLSILGSTSTEDYRRVMKDFYPLQFLDGVCLQTFPNNGRQDSTPSSPMSYTAIKWLLMRSVMETLHTAMDYCFLESCYQLNAETGILSLLSIQRPGQVPSLSGYNISRGQFHRTGIVVKKTARPGMLCVTSVFQVNVSEILTPMSTASHAQKMSEIEHYMKRYVRSISRLIPVLERRRLDGIQVIEKWRWVPNEQRKECCVCSKKFKIHRKHHCRSCGEVVCASCAPHRELDVTSVGVVSMRICTICVMRIRKERLDDTLKENEITHFENPAISFSGKTECYNTRCTTSTKTTVPVDLLSISDTASLRSIRSSPGSCRARGNAMLEPQYPLLKNGTWFTSKNSDSHITYGQIHDDSRRMQRNNETDDSSAALLTGSNVLLYNDNYFAAKADEQSQTEPKLKDVGGVDKSELEVVRETTTHNDEENQSNTSSDYDSICDAFDTESDESCRHDSSEKGRDLKNEETGWNCLEEDSDIEEYSECSSLESTDTEAIQDDIEEDVDVYPENNNNDPFPKDKPNGSRERGNSTRISRLSTRVLYHISSVRKHNGAGIDDPGKIRHLRDYNYIVKELHEVMGLTNESVPQGKSENSVIEQTDSAADLSESTSVSPGDKGKEEPQTNEELKAAALLKEEDTPPSSGLSSHVQKCLNVISEKHEIDAYLKILTTLALVVESCMASGKDSNSVAFNRYKDCYAGLPLEAYKILKAGGYLLCGDRLMLAYADRFTNLRYILNLINNEMERLTSK